LKILKKIQILVLRIFFPFFQKIGIHVLPVHYYSPVPDTRKIPEHTWGVSKEGSKLIGKQYLYFISEMKNYLNQFQIIADGKLEGFNIKNGSFETVDAESYYGMIMILKPRKIIEIGSGHSTKIAVAAVNDNKLMDSKYNCDIICIEPFPSVELSQNKQVKLIRNRLEDVDRDLFNELNKNDILFIDSTHTLKIGNDVYCEYLEIIPNINVGVYIHIHDIFIPNQYSKRWVYKKNYFWTEQYILQAFLMFNSHYEVVFPCNYLHSFKPDLLMEIFPSYPMDEEGPGSFWIRRI
jgi:hypothetical protein